MGAQPPVSDCAAAPRPSAPCRFQEEQAGSTNRSKQAHRILQQWPGACRPLVGIPQTSDEEVLSDTGRPTLTDTDAPPGSVTSWTVSSAVNRYSNPPRRRGPPHRPPRRVPRRPPRRVPRRVPRRLPRTAQSRAPGSAPGRHRNASGVSRGP